MVNRAWSQEKKRRQVLNATKKWEEITVQQYREEQERVLEQGGRRKGLQSICREINARCLEEDKITIEITKSTLARRLSGVKSLAETNWERNSLLSDKEEDELVAFALACSDQGFPLTHKQLEEHALELCQAKYGEDFNDMGHNWTDRFLIRHDKQLKACWSHALDNQRAQCTNPITKKDYFEKLKAILDGEEGEEPIMPECIYGVDETGIQTGVGQREQVLGQKTTKVQQQQRSGNRENITVIVTICADGASLPPAVIFKGKLYQTSWKQNNPLNASLGYSDKGWTDGEIGVEWIKQFDAQTREKANGRRRLLLVDGHNSHYTLGFLQYARDNRIEVLCYPSHSTHLFQGLDIIIFSPLKKAWTKSHDDYEREKGRVNKGCFLEVYGRAHQEALSSHNIITAFRKTGVVPFNPDVITEDLLAPSRETSTSTGLPVPPDSPVRIVSDLLHATVARQAAEDLESEVNCSASPSQCQNPLATPTRRAQNELSSSSAVFLVTATPVKSTHIIPRFKPYTISPFQQRNPHLQDFQPTNEREAMLWDALQEAETRDTRRKHNMLGLQAQVVLQEVYVKRVKSQLQEAETRKKKDRSLVFGDGMSRLLTGPDFLDGAVKRQQQKDEADDEKAA
ncbi:hypothetical protein EST38_g10826 [Candolleomyces aberdarensis]|uniref:HTH CENPB-type domain-containing protein n=1 Tax=Candolleomyces aberdarensis TaxID=2316362 RepID=A0A4V1Q2G7_9AGAR|nr:hypothetical protein EST38_g10826 [Candolleomyces aberdarensis]